MDAFRHLAPLCRCQGWDSGYRPPHRKFRLQIRDTKPSVLDTDDASLTRYIAWPGRKGEPEVCVLRCKERVVRDRGKLVDTVKELGLGWISCKDAFPSYQN